MAGRGRRSGRSRWLLAFAVALGLFWAAGALVSAGPAEAHAVALPPAAREARAAGPSLPAPAALHAFHAPASAYAGHGRQPFPEHGLLFFSLAVAVLAAVNIGFYRHLRRVYASPRRSVWRRG
jgi:hypothetical protein